MPALKAPPPAMPRTRTTSCCLNTELRVCTSRSCRQQKAQAVLDAARELAPAEVKVMASGCLARCGSGPNVQLRPSGLEVSFVSSTVELAELIQLQCEGGAGTVTVAEALRLRRRGEKALEAGSAGEALTLLSDALLLEPVRGGHLLLGVRSSARLALGDAAGSLQDAVSATAAGPPDWTKGMVREAAALLALGDQESARAALAAAAARDRSVLRLDKEAVALGVALQPEESVQ